MKKTLSVLFVLLIVCSFAFAGGESESSTAAAASSDTTTVKVGLICIGDENDQGYTYNFIRGRDEATEILAKEGINVEWMTIYNIGEDASCIDANIEAAEEGCQIIINNSYGFEPYMLEVVDDYPEIEFISCTNCASVFDGRENTHNAFANIYEGRYIAGVVAGMKLQFVGSWSDATAESDAALALIDEGCVMISQHSDNTTPATAAQSRGVFHTGYNNDMTGIAPDASLIGTRIDWGIYFSEAIRNYVNGEPIPQDWCAGMAEGAVVMTPLNEAIAAPGTVEKIAEVEAALADGSLEVFDTSTFTVGGQELTHAFALDTDGDFTADRD